MGAPFKIVRIKSLPPQVLPSKAELAKSYQLFCEFLRHIDGFGDSPFPAYKHELLQALDDNRFNSIESDILIMEPRAHAKTTVDVIPYAPWRWLSEPWLRVGVYSAGERHSKKITRGIIRIVERLAKFGYYKIKDKKMQELTLYHDKPYIDPSLECFPIQGNSSVGSRKDIIIADDVYTTENANSDIKAAEIKERYDQLTDLWSPYKYPKRLTIGTRLHTGDLYDDIINGKWGHKVLWYPIIPERLAVGLPNRLDKNNIEEAKRIHSMCIWPDIIPLPKFISAYNSPRRWNTQYMLRPLNNAMPIFLREDILTTSTNISINDFEPEKFAIIIDPAAGQSGTKGDNCAIVVGGIAKDGKWHIVDGWFSNQFTVNELCEAWKKIVLKWRNVINTGGYHRDWFPSTYVEAAAMQSLLQHPLRQAALDAPIRGNIAIRMQTTGNIKKELRIEGFLSPIISRNQLIIHNCPVAGQLINELVNFPGYRFRDVADATAGMIKALARYDARWKAILQGEQPELFRLEAQE
jgi:hypothetical protein